jgi:hypothetical protein
MHLDKYYEMCERERNNLINMQNVQLSYQPIIVFVAIERPMG